MSTHDDFRSCDTGKRRFGLCYQCIDGIHAMCLGVPCDCACPTPPREPAPDPDEVRRALEAHQYADHPWPTLAAAARAWLRERS